MTGDFLVLIDEAGDLYTITPELIRLCEVKSDDHRQTLVNLPKAPGACNELAALGFSSLGQIDAASDPRIKKEFVEPMLKIVDAPNAPNP